MSRVANACVKEQWKTPVGGSSLLRYKRGQKVGRGCQHCGVVTSLNLSLISA